MGQDNQSHLCCCLDNTSPRLAFTSTSTAASGCSMSRPEELVPVSTCSCPPSGPQFFHSKVNFTSKIVLAKCDFDFHSEVTSPLKNVLASELLTSQERTCKCTFDFHSQVTSLRFSSHSGRLASVARVSFVAQSSCSCELDTAPGATHPAVEDAHYGLGFARGAVSAQILPQGATRHTGQGCTLLFPILFVAQLSSQLSPS